MNKAVLIKLYYNNEIVGTRLNINNSSNRLYDTPFDLEVVEGILDKYNFSHKVSRHVEKGKLKKQGKDKIISFDNDFLAVEMSSIKELSKVLEHSSNYGKLLQSIANDFGIIISKDIESPLRHLGFTSKEQQYDYNNLVYACRFLGGFSAWFSSEDVCDSSILNSKVKDALDSVLKQFNKKYGVNAYFVIGEKAWIYIYIK